MTSRKKQVKPLTPPDLKQCQAEKPNGESFMTLGGRPGRVRCTSPAKILVRETVSGSDGQKGSMTLCGDCFVVFQTQCPDARVSFELIERMKEVGT